MPNIPGFAASSVTLTNYKIFLSSNSELTSERKLFEEILDELNSAMHLSDHTVALELLAWEKLTSFRAQDGINKQIIESYLSKAHLVVGLLAENLGKGTQQELEKAIEDDMPLSIIALGTNRSEELLKFIDYLMANEVEVLFIEVHGVSAYTLLLRAILQPTLALLQKRGEPVHEIR